MTKATSLILMPVLLSLLVIASAEIVRLALTPNVKVYGLAQNGSSFLYQFPIEKGDQVGEQLADALSAFNESRPVAVMFAGACKGCAQSSVEAFLGEFSPSDQVLMVAELSADEDYLQELTTSQRADVKYILDSDRAVSNEIGVTWTPFLFVVSRDEVLYVYDPSKPLASADLRRAMEGERL